MIALCSGNPGFFSPCQGRGGLLVALLLLGFLKEDEDRTSVIDYGVRYGGNRGIPSFTNTQAIILSMGKHKHSRWETITYFTP